MLGKTMLRRIAACILIFTVTGPALLFSQNPDPIPENPYPVSAEPVMLDTREPARREIDGLRYLGGWVLQSEDPDFGGISAMAIDENGFLAVGDAGGVFRFALDDRGTIANADIMQLPAGPVPDDGGDVQKRDRDAEALACDPATGTYWVAFERANGL